MSNTIIYKNNLHIEKEFDLSENMMAKEIDQILTELIFDIKLNGFRKLAKQDLQSTDKKIQDQIKKRKDIILNQQKEYILNKAKQEYIQHIVENETKDKNILSLSDEIKDNTLFIKYDLYENLTISDIANIEINDYQLSNIDTLVESKLKILQTETFIDSNKKIQENDQIRFEIKFYIEHTDKMNEKLSDIILDNLDNDFISKEILLQHKKNDVISHKLTLNKSLEEKYLFLSDKDNILMEITILDVKSPQKVEFTDEFVQEKYNISSIAELKTIIANDHQEQFESYKLFLLEYDIANQIEMSVTVSQNIFDQYKEEHTEREYNKDKIAEHKIKINLLLNHFQQKYNIKLETSDIVTFLMKQNNKKAIEHYQQNHQYQNKINNAVMNMKILKYIANLAQKTISQITMEELEKKINNIHQNLQQNIA